MDKIGGVIGPGGRNIQATQDASGATNINVRVLCFLFKI